MTHPLGILHIETAKTCYIYGIAKTCLEGNTHRLADVGNRGQAQRSPRQGKQVDNSLEGFTSTFKSINHQHSFKSEVVLVVWVVFVVFFFA